MICIINNGTNGDNQYGKNDDHKNLILTILFDKP